MLLVVLLVMTLLPVPPSAVTVGPLVGIIVTIPGTMKDRPEPMVKMTVVEPKIMVGVVQCKRPGKRKTKILPKKIDGNQIFEDKSKNTWQKERISDWK